MHLGNKLGGGNLKVPSPFFAGVPIGNTNPERINDMGMDVYGTAPTDPVGEYFRRNVWGWHPLVDCTEHVCQQANHMDLFLRCEEWHTNDGDGLNATDATALASLIDQAISTGVIEKWLADRQAKIRMMQPTPCNYCKGTGIRTDAVGEKAGLPTKVIPADAKDMTWRDEYLSGERPKHPRAGQTGTCNACDGTGKTAPFEQNYGTSLESMTDWSQFLKHCGGFEIC